MGRGLGKAQLSILAALGYRREPMTTAALAEWSGRSARQVRTAVDALERRGLVVVTREFIGMKGRGEYGPMTMWTRDDDDPDKIVRDWDGRSYERIRQGTPTYGRLVWSPDVRADYLRKQAQAFAEVQRLLRGF